MIGTEKRLWATLKATNEKSEDARMKMTRIETSTVTGVSDIEYVSPKTGWHGWIELKTSSTKKLDAAIRLHHPLSLQQLAWLVSHNAPQYHLRSWLLVGFLGARTWREFALLAPPVAGYLSEFSPQRVSKEHLANKRGCVFVKHAEEALDIVKSWPQ